MGRRQRRRATGSGTAGGRPPVPDGPGPAGFHRHLADSPRLRCLAGGDGPAHPPARPPGRVTYSQLRAAASWDPAAFRAFWTINGMICPPEEVYTDPDVIASTQETLRRHGTAPPVAQPTREQLLTALGR